jgi:hypothetical protein
LYAEPKLRFFEKESKEGSSGQFEIVDIPCKSLQIAKNVLCGHLRDIICETSEETEECLIARILAASEEIEIRPKKFNSFFS